MTSDAQREYYDTGIWIAYMLQNDKFFIPSSALFDRLLSSNNRIVVISNLVLVESTHVFRRKIVKFLDRIFDHKQAQLSAISRDNYLSTAFTKRLFQLEKSGHLELYEPDLLLNVHHKEVLSKLRRQPIHMRSMAKGYQYAGLGPADIEHAYLARRAGVSDFYTTDCSFKQLNGDPEFAGMSFNALNPEHV